MDRVKITNIKELFKDPSELAKKVIDVEKSKEGVFDVSIISSTETPIIVTSTSDISRSSTSVPSYLIEYTVDSSRGNNHYLVRSSIAQKRLFVATVQTKNDDWTSLEVEGRRAVNSLQLIQPQ